MGDYLYNLLMDHIPSRQRTSKHLSLVYSNTLQNVEIAITGIKLFHSKYKDMTG